MTEPEVIDELEKWYKEGAAARDALTANPHRAGTLAYYMHMNGWLRRDLQLCLCRSDEAYRRSQIACGNVTEAQLKGQA